MAAAKVDEEQIWDGGGPVEKVIDETRTRPWNGRF